MFRILLFLKLYIFFETSVKWILKVKFPFFLKNFVSLRAESITDYCHTLRNFSLLRHHKSLGLNDITGRSPKFTEFTVKFLRNYRFDIQAALAIRGFGYSRMQKPQITRENCYFEPKLILFSLKCRFCYLRFEIFPGT